MMQVLWPAVVLQFFCHHGVHIALHCNSVREHRLQFLKVRLQKRLQIFVELDFFIEQQDSEI